MVVYDYICLMELVFATNNNHKLTEVRSLAGNKFSVIGLKDAGLFTEIPEDQSTIEGNASQKSWYIHNIIHSNCLADDTGLEVFAINGEPGVFSARYSRIGKPVFPQMEVVTGNIHKLLYNLRGKSDRSARFRTVISLILDGKEFLFEGIVEGTILETARGSAGFGYDPVFLPKGHTRSFAEMTLQEKNLISHRAMAIHELMDFLHKL